MDLANKSIEEIAASSANAVIIKGAAGFLYALEFGITHLEIVQPGINFHAHIFPTSHQVNCLFVSGPV